MSLDSDQQARPDPALDRPDSAEDEPGELEQLLVAVANYQDRRAFERLFICFSRRIYGMGMKIARNEQVARDLVQEVMLIVWQNASTYDLDKGTAKSWIFTLSRNRCIDMLRRAKRQPHNLGAEDTWPDDLCDADLDRPDQNAETLVSDKDQINRIEKLSDRLPAAQHQAIKMVYIHEHTHEEAARKLAIPLGTLKSRLRLGLIKLRELLGEHNA